MGVGDRNHFIKKLFMFLSHYPKTKNLLVVMMASCVLLTCDKKESEEQGPKPPVIIVDRVEVANLKIGVYGFITNESNIPILDYGYAWDVSRPFFETSPSKSLGAMNGAGEFIGEVSAEQVAPNTIYNLRAYCKTKDGVFYSTATSFRSPDLQPMITSLQPGIASWGDTVRITGFRYSTKPENNKITFGDFAAVCVKATPTLLVTVVPATLNVSDVKIKVTVEGKETTENAIFKLVAPSITSFTPLTGAAGTKITIIGKNFKDKLTHAFLDGVPMTLTAVTPTEITAEIPRVLTSGSLEVSVHVASQTVMSTTRFLYNGVKINEYSPPSGTYDDIITIRGVGFSSIASSNKVMFDNHEAAVIESGSGFLKVAVPHGLLAASSKISVSNAMGYNLSQSEFHLLAPEITSISPAHPGFRQRVTIIGKNFNPARQNNILKVGKTTVTVEEATNTSLTFQLWDSYWAPDGKSPLSVSIGERVAQAPSDLEIAGPSITSFSPQTGKRSDVVMMHGQNFHVNNLMDTIYFGDAYTIATTSSSNMLTFKVPKGAGGGTYDVQLRVGGKMTSLGSFTVDDIWTSKEKQPGGGRSLAIAFSIGGKGYIGGGRNTSQNISDFYQFDPVTNQWTKKANIPINEQGMIGFATSDYGYVLYRRQLWQFNPTTNTWAQKANFPGQAFFSQISFTLGSKAYVGLGQQEYGFLTTEFYEYDESTNQWTQKAAFTPGGYHGCASFSAGGKGYVTTGSWMLNDIWEYNPATNTWAKKLSLVGVIPSIATVGRFGAIGISTPDKGYFGTGRQLSSYFAYASDMYEYDPASNTCKRLIDLPGEGRADAFGFGIGNKIYIGGGVSYLPWGSSEFLSDLFEYDGN